MTDDEIRNIANANTIEYDSEDGESSFSLNIFDFARALLAASSAATVSDAARVPSDKTLRTLVLQIADMKPKYEENVVAGMNLLRNAFAATTAVVQDELAHPFAALCDLLPSEVSWGDSLTPDIVRHIARAASSATAPLTSDSEAQMESPKETMERLTRQFNQMSELERAVIGDFIKRAQSTSGEQS